MLAIIVEAAVRSLVFAATIWLALKAFRVTNPHIEMAAWRLVLFGSLAMPFLGGLPSFPVPTGTLPSEGVRELHSMLSADPPLLLSPSAGPVWPELQAPAVDWRKLGLAIYLLVAAFLILRLLIGIILTARLCCSATPVRESWTLGHDVRASASIRAPASFATTILLPLDYPSWDGTQRDAVMAHESWHVRQGDFYVLLLTAMNRGVFWFSPLAWWLHGRIRYLAEARSDAAAMRQIDDRVRYAGKSCCVSAPQPAPRRSVWRWPER